ncbi:unnamed protein product [Ostreobium quekettii]|uniref:Uncharacterized protein n=1 Tax=Ostreobium quekettii TaxID=121088 RepID=A0A8S1J315_9CHLO|nr:unnamed protein product [Ostreobium quekettii]
MSLRSVRSPSPQSAARPASASFAFAERFKGWRLWAHRGLASLNLVADIYWRASPAGGSEHQSPAFAGQAPWIGEQAPHPQAVRMIGISLDGHVTSLALRHRFPLQGRPQDLHGQEGWMPWMDFREQRLLSAQQVDSHPLGRNVRASHGRGSELTPPSPQRAVVEDVNLMSESDAEGGCGLSSLRTGECSEGSVRSRRVPQATC